VQIGCAFAFSHLVKTHLSNETERLDVYGLYVGTQTVVMCIDCMLGHRPSCCI